MVLGAHPCGFRCELARSRIENRADAAVDIDRSRNAGREKGAGEVFRREEIESNSYRV